MSLTVLTLFVSASSLSASALNQADNELDRLGKAWASCEADGQDCQKIQQKLSALHRLDQARDRALQNCQGSGAQDCLKQVAQVYDAFKSYGKHPQLSSAYVKVVTQYGIENFWNQAKHHMRKLNGLPKAHFRLFLKECEWRFNNSDPSNKLSKLKQWVKCYLRYLSGTAPKIFSLPRIMFSL